MSLRVGGGRGGGVTDHTVLPGLPVILSPAAGGIDVDSDSAITVETAPPDFGAGTAPYVHAATEIQIYRVTDQTQVHAVMVDGLSETLPPRRLARGEQYAVRARHKAAIGWWTNWSQFCLFTTLAAPDWFAEIGAPTDAVSVWDWAGGRAHNAGFYFLRPSPAYDLSAGAWTEYPANHLRTRTGAGVLLETASRNLALNSIANGAAVDTLPDGWTITGPTGNYPTFEIEPPQSGVGFAGSGYRIGSKPTSSSETIITPHNGRFPVETQRQYVFSLFARERIYTSGVNYTFGNQFLRVNWYRANGSRITWSQKAIGRLPTTPARYELVATAPADAVEADITLLTYGSSAYTYYTTGMHVFGAVAEPVSSGQAAAPLIVEVYGEEIIPVPDVLEERALLGRGDVEPFAAATPRASSPMPAGDVPYERAADEMLLYIAAGPQRLTFVLEDDSTLVIDVPGGDYAVDPAMLGGKRVMHNWTVAA